LAILSFSAELVGSEGVEEFELEPAEALRCSRAAILSFKLPVAVGLEDIVRKR
jgi:hypothetical protein